MLCWYCIPIHDGSAAAECLSSWKSLGYHVAVVGESLSLQRLSSLVDLVLIRNTYDGYAEAVNYLWKIIGARADIFITGGFDVWPDPNFKANDAAELYLSHFPLLEGVMQPTGDSFTPPEDFRVSAPSPWIGRRFSLSVYGGIGPLWPGYFHSFVDWELFEVASRLGVYAIEPKLSQRHNRWTNDSRGWPSYLSRAKAAHSTDRNLLHRRRQMDYPGAFSSSAQVGQMEDTL
jgi:hypothetical protein